MAIFVWDSHKLLPHSSVPTSVFPVFPILIVEKNVCNTLGLVRVELLGSLELVGVDMLGS